MVLNFEFQSNSHHVFFVSQNSTQRLDLCLARTSISTGFLPHLVQLLLRSGAGVLMVDSKRAQGDFMDISRDNHGIIDGI